MKKAFHARLLQYHPDKQSTTSSAQDEQRGKDIPYTIDEIKEAFAILTDGHAREEWEALFARERWRMEPQSTNGRNRGGDNEFVLGLEVLDLEDFKERIEDGEGGELMAVWTRECRCGVGGGFRVTEHDLEAAVDRCESEVLVGCRGCSLWVRVGFGILEGEDERFDVGSVEDSKL